MMRSCPFPLKTRKLVNLIALYGEDVTKEKSKNTNKPEEPGEDWGVESEKESESRPALNPTKVVTLNKRGREESTKGKDGLLLPSGRDHPTSNLAPANWPCSVIGQRRL